MFSTSKQDPITGLIRLLDLGPWFGNDMAGKGLFRVKFEVSGNQPIKWYLYNTLFWYSIFLPFHFLAVSPRENTQPLSVI